jgi:hypothetical protein
LLLSFMRFTGLRTWLIAGALLAFVQVFTSAQTYTVGTGWLNAPISAQTGSVTVLFDATPSGSALDGVIGFSFGPASAYSSLATIVRFNASGFIDARNGGTYAASTQIPYSANVAYHVRLELNIPAHVYSIYVTPSGQAEQMIGSNFQFRIEQNSVTELNNFAGQVSTGGTIAVTGLRFNGGNPANLPPTVQLTGPANGTSLLAPASVLITATASDPDGTIARVEFYQGSTLVGSDTTSPYSFTMAGILAGAFQVTARAVDNSGATSESAPVSVTVTAPNVETASLQLAWDPSLSTDVVAYRIYIGNAPGQYFTSNRVGNVTICTITNLAVGRTYYFAATAISRAEAESEFSNTVAAQPDLERPSVSGGIVSGSFQLSSQGVPSKVYIIDQSDDFRQWTTAATLAADADGRFTFRHDPVEPHRFFRVREQ